MIGIGCARHWRCNFPECLVPGPTQALNEAGDITGFYHTSGHSTGCLLLASGCAVLRVYFAITGMLFASMPFISHAMYLHTGYR